MYGEPTEHTAPQSGLMESWQYDHMGQLSSAISAGMKYEYSHYPGGLLREKRASGRTLISYTYDLDGRKISQRDLTGKSTGYTYNRNGMLSQVMENASDVFPTDVNSVLVNCFYKQRDNIRDIEKIIENIDILYEKYKVDKSFYNKMSNQEKIRGMKGILAELDLKKKVPYEDSDVEIIKDIYFVCC